MNTLFIKSSRIKRSYRQVYQFSRAFQTALVEINGRNPAGIILLLPDSPWKVMLIAACWLLGIPFIPFSTRWSRPEIEKRLSLVPADFIITTSAFIPLFNEHTRYMDLKKVKEIEAESASFEPAPHSEEIPDEAFFAYLFTSGTTGEPKLVPLKRSQMIAATRNAARDFLLQPGEFWYLSLPLNHIGGVAVIIRSLLYQSGIFVSFPFDAAVTAHDFSEHQEIKAASLVTAMFQTLTKVPGFRLCPSFKAILLGGGPVPSELLKQAARHHWPVFVSYGMTETCAQIASAKALDFMSGGGLALFPSHEVEIRSTINDNQPSGQTGLIWLRGPQVFDGYIHPGNKAETVFDENDWFCTNDYGYLDKARKLHIQGRDNDTVISGGENISCREIEHVLETYSEIKEAAAVGIPDSYWGEKLVAFLVLEEETSLQQDKLKERLKSDLASFKIPKAYKIVSELPRTALGKLKRKELKNLYFV